jgi:hypothetical protein
MAGSLKATPLLDIFQGAGAAWSLRRLRSAYTGNCICVRRSADNTQLNIGFKNGMLDTAALLAFTGTGNGFVTIFYDQSGNNQNLVQTLETRQPQIVSNGNLMVENGKPALQFDGINDYLEVPASQNYFRNLHSNKALIAIVTRIGNIENADLACGLVDTGGAAGAQIGYSLFYDNRRQFTRVNSLVNNVSTGATASVVSQDPNRFLVSNKQYIISNRLDLTNTTANQRSFLKTNNNPDVNINFSINTPNTAASTHPLKLGAVHISNIINFHQGTFQEIVIYLTNQTGIDNALRNNIISYYNITDMP